MANNFSCDVNYLLAQSACFMDSCMGEADRDAIELAIRVQNLKASGGADYTTDIHGLLVAAKTFQPLACHQRKAISLWIDLQNALDNGAVFAHDVNSLKALAKCYECIPMETKKNTLEYLKCSINSLGKPD